MEDLDHGLNVAVIGAGWAGMAAAVTLAQAGARVTVFESARHAGGRARTIEMEGMSLDNGQHLLIGAYRETLRLMRAVGADPERLLLRQPIGIMYPGKFELRAPRLPAPLHLLAALATASGPAWSERLAAMRFMTAMRRSGYRLAADMTVAELLARHGQGGTLARYLWEPLCVSALNTPAASASAQVFLNLFRDALDGTRANSDFLIPRTDLGALFPEPAMDYLRAHNGTLRLGTRVKTLEKNAGGFMLDAGLQRYSRVIVAVGPHQIGGLLDRFPPLEPTRSEIAAFDYEPIYTCYLQYPAKISLPRAMTGFDNSCVQWVFDRGRLNGMRGVLAAVISAQGVHQDIAQEELAHRIHRELAACMPGLPAPRWSRVIAEKRATFACRAGMVRPDNRTAVEGLYLAGDYTAGDYPATLESAVRSGVRAAELVRQGNV